MPTTAQTVSLNLMASENEALLIFAEWRGGVRTVYETEFKDWSHAEIQHQIDSAVTPRCTITAVKVVGSDDTVRDISAAFDLRTAEEIYDAMKEDGEREFDAVVPLYTQATHGTLNRSQQGI